MAHAGAEHLPAVRTTRTSLSHPETAAPQHPKTTRAPSRQAADFPTPPLPPPAWVNALGRRALSESTKPEPLIDLSGFVFKTHRRPDGREVQIERWGEIAIPDLLAPGGEELPPLYIEGSQARFQVFGDTGKGTAAQFEVAENIVAMAKERGIHANMLVGDIIYPRGLTSASDPKLEALYLKPYGALREVHLMYGNHEYGDSRGAGVPEAWLEAARTGQAGDARIPQRYYSRRFIVDGMTIRALFLDTSTIAVDPLQLAWIKREVEKGADYTLVFGHHPIYSAGLHGVLPHMEKLLMPLLEGKADMYVCGHDHNLQLLRTQRGLPLMVSGSAGEERVSWRTPKTEFFSQRMGTAFISIDRAGIDAEWVNGKSRESLHKARFARRQA